MSRATDRRGFVYCLHFSDPLAHAQHYVGCTTDLRQRMVTHARGSGANIVRVAMENGLTWHCAAVGVTTVTKMRTLERQVKNWKGPHRFCATCAAKEGKEPLQMPGTQSIDLELIGHPLDSISLAKMAPVEAVAVRFTNDQEPLLLLTQLKAIMQREKHALGFIPVGGEGGLTLSVTAGRVVVAMRGGGPIGFLAFTENEKEVRIQQCVVNDSERGSGIGRQMVEMLRKSRREKWLMCRVRADLHAVGFWKAVGFKEAGRSTHETSAAEIIRFVDIKGG